MDCADEDAYHAVRQDHSGYRNPDNRIHGNGNRTFYRSKNSGGRYDQRHGHNQTRSESHFRGTNNRHQNLRRNSAGDDRLVEPQRISSTGRVNGTGFDKVPPAVTDTRKARNAGEVTAENGVCPKETTDSVSASANVTTTVVDTSSNSRPTSTISMPNVWKDRQDFCRDVRPNTAEEEEEMLRKALEMSKLDELERRSEIDEEDLRSLPSLIIDVDEQEQQQARTTSPADDDPAIFKVVSSSTSALPPRPSSTAETTALPSAVEVPHPHPRQEVSVSQSVEEDWDAECIEIEVHRPQLANSFHCPTNFDDQNQDSTMTSGGCNPSTINYEQAHLEQAFPDSSHFSENVSTPPATLHPSCSIAYACSPVDHIRQTDSLPTSAGEWSFSASSGPPLSHSSATESHYQEQLHAGTDCDVKGLPPRVEPNFTANQDSDLPFNDSSTVITEQFSPSLNHTSEPFHRNPEPPLSGSHTTIEPSYFHSSEQSSFHRVITTSHPPGFNACSPSGIAVPDESEESGFTFTFTDTEQLGYGNHPLPESNCSISPNEHESPCNFSESERSATSSVSFPSGEAGILQDTTAVDEVMNYIPDQQQLPANGICPECHCEKNAYPPAYSSNPFGTICGHGFPAGPIPFLCPPLWTGHPHLMHLSYPPHLGYPVYPGPLPYMASPYSVLPSGLPGLGHMPGVIPGYLPLQHQMLPVASPFGMTRPFTASQQSCSCGSDQSCMQMHSTKPCD